MDRRLFVRNLAVGGAASAAATASAQSGTDNLPTIKWRVQNSYPKSLGEIYKLQEDTMTAIGKMTAGKFTCQFFQANELVPVPGMINAVGNGTIEAAYSASLFYVGINKAFAFGSGLPFGMNARVQYAWLRFGGGNELLDKELYSQYGVVHIPSSTTGCQMGGWFRKEIRSLADLQGLKMRIAGLGGEVLSQMGVVAQMLPPADIYTALEKGTIDSVEWVGPYDDEKLGFNKVAPFYYFPGWWEGGPQLSLYVNSKSYEALPAEYKAALAAAASHAHVVMQARYDARNPEALKRLVGGGAKLRPMPRPIMDASLKIANEIYADLSAKNANWKKVYEDWVRFRGDQVLWFRVAEREFDNFMSAQKL